MPPKTAVIMPAYNAAGFIAEAIESVRAQTVTDWTLVVVDDGSVDATADIVRRYISDPRIKLVRQVNGGCAAARRTAMLNSESAYVALLDADDRYEPTYLEEMTRVLDAGPNLAFVCCDAYLFGDVRRQGMLSSLDNSREPPVTLERVISRDFMVFVAVAMRREAADRAGGFDAALRASEDFDLWLRMLAGGGAAAFINKPLVWYRCHAGSLSKAEERLWETTEAAYQKVKVLRPDMAALCERMIGETRYQRALIRAKKALKDRRHADFLAESRQALSLRRNPKLAFAAGVARLSPQLAHTLFAWRV